MFNDNFLCFVITVGELCEYSNSKNCALIAELINCLNIQCRRVAL